MTNKELKAQTFKTAYTKWQQKQEEHYKRCPEQKLYDEGVIGWNEYLQLTKEREEKEREFYKGNEDYQLYVDGLITWEDFQELEKKRLAI